MNSSVLHPYYPVSLHLPHYVANSKGTPLLLFMFAAVLGFVLIPAYILITTKRDFALSTRLSFLWFITCGCIHLFFEGYFAVNHATLASKSTLFGELWKEYALSDSRYLSSDSFVLWMETLTAFLWGPLSFIIAYQIFNDDPKRHLGIVVVSAGQIYGDILYYMTTLYEGAPHSRPEPYYFWCYFVLMNAFWIVIPGSYIFNSSQAILTSLSQTSDKKKKV
ncbi:hypothetical protein DSO57_1036095 [Entomophthora muscae]|uniref:Uncharacterized protein n=1 Tax=Entomophthora muscae TaxID=34485 RepID=A0ACC2UKB7_9FUNG|nr:hypothetical protein DSO57_1036095 [Entomophthora muscae]